MQLEEDLPVRLDVVRQELAAAHAVEVAALQTRGAAQVEAAVRDEQTEAAQMLVETVQRSDTAFAVVRAQLGDAEARRVQLEEDLPVRLDAARQELATAHAAQVAALEAAAAEQLEAVRRGAETALATREAELKAHSAEQVEMAARGARDDAGRAAVDTAQQHDAALAAVQAQLEDAEARRVQLEEDLPVRLDAARRELAAEHVAQVAALEAATAGRLEAVRRDAETALATREAELKAHAAEQVEMAAREARDDAGRAAADTAQQHDAALAAVRAQLEEAEARQVQLEQDLPARVEAVRQELAAAHGVQVAALETRAAGRLEAVRRDAETALATREAELKAHAAEQVEMAARGARDDAGRAAVAAAQQHDAALAAVRAQLEDVEVGRVQLEQDLPVRVAAMRRETDAAHGSRSRRWKPGRPRSSRRPGATRRPRSRPRRPSSRATRPRGLEQR